MRDDIKKEVRDLAFENEVARASRPQKSERPPAPKKILAPYEITPSEAVVERLCGVAADVWVLAAIATPTEEELTDGNIVDVAALKEWIRAAKKARDDLQTAIDFAVKECVRPAPLGTRISQARCTIGLLRRSSDCPF